ncbi:MAG TPA: hypothetical protein VK738_16765 [Terriglobales bacterium]|nr:hypothetical protein [Terriglobales bacterium]
MTTTLRKPASFKPSLEFKSSGLRGRLQPVCNQVLKQFHQLPSLRLLCYFDDENPERLQKHFGQFAGIHIPILGAVPWPDYVEHHFFDWAGEIAFDNLIYVPGTRYAQERVHFVIIFSHELQHFIQWGFARKVYQANVLLFQNLHLFDPTTEVKPWGLPLNRDAMIVAKRVAGAVCGMKRVKEFIELQINDGKQATNISKTQMWEWIRTISPSAPRYDLYKETDHLVQKYRTKLIRLKSDIDFSKSEWWL